MNATLINLNALDELNEHFIFNEDNNFAVKLITKAIIGASNVSILKCNKGIPKEVKERRYVCWWTKELLTH